MSVLASYVIISLNLPYLSQAKLLAEFDGDRPDLLPQLPAELPNKDDLEGQLPGVALPQGVEAPLTEDQLVDSLVGLPWEFIINKDARQEWARMDRPFRRALSAAGFLMHRFMSQVTSQKMARKLCCTLHITVIQRIIQWTQYRLETEHL